MILIDALLCWHRHYAVSRSSQWCPGSLKSNSGSLHGEGGDYCMHLNTGSERNNETLLVETPIHTDTTSITSITLISTKPEARRARLIDVGIGMRNINARVPRHLIIIDVCF